MVKVADALAEEGYDVNVVSTQFIEWGDEGDRSIVASRWTRWRWTTIDYRKRDALPRYLLSGLRMRGAKQIMRVRGLKRIGLATAARIRERVVSELVNAVVRTRPSLIYGGGSALAATSIAARKLGIPFALDLEDFQSAQDAPDRYAGVTDKIERAILPLAAMLTGGSRAIAEEYRSVYGVDVIPIHNVFPLPAAAPTVREWDGNLRLYWLGQTIGQGRGLEEIIRAAGAAEITSEFTIRGLGQREYLDSLRTLATQVAPRLTLTPLAPAPPDDMVDLCRPHDIVIAIETPQHRSHELALTNKSLTYILAGLAVAMSDTPGQHELGADLGEGAFVCQPSNIIDPLAKELRKWSDDPAALARAKEATWAAARRRWHWEHPEERGRMLEAIAGVVK
jgi:hypothetical protein